MLILLKMHYMGEGVRKFKKSGYIICEQPHQPERHLATSSPSRVIMHVRTLCLNKFVISNLQIFIALFAKPSIIINQVPGVYPLSISRQSRFQICREMPSSGFCNIVILN